jgi:hypothetical protein
MQAAGLAGIDSIGYTNKLAKYASLVAPVPWQSSAGSLTSFSGFHARPLPNQAALDQGGAARAGLSLDEARPARPRRPKTRRAHQIENVDCPALLQQPSDSCWAVGRYPPSGV